MTPDQIAQTFAGAVAGFGPGTPLVVTHNDADGLSAGALLARALSRAGREPDVRVLGRGESPWSPEVRASLAAARPAGMVVSDLGLREGAICPGVPTVVIDHHVPTGDAGGATVITGHGMEPIPTASLLAWWCAGGLGEAGDLEWLAAMGVIGDLGDKAPIPMLPEARRRWGATALREAVSLVNAPRRSATGDAAPAMALLLRAEDAKSVSSGVHPETAALQAARLEVREALEQARRLPPRVQGEVALIRMHSPCQVHPMVAQSWRGRLRDKVVMAANTGFRPGWVHFAVRSGQDRDLIAFLRERRPEGAGEEYGNGHREATGGALRPDAWNSFVAGLGFGPEMAVAA